MKGLIYVVVFLMIGLMFMGCTGTTANQRKEASDPGTSVSGTPSGGFYSPEVEDRIMYGR
jgi:hypothetical protein